MKVDRDSGASRYSPDDPELIGRTLVISRNQVVFDRGKELSCKPGTWEPQRSRWSDLFGKSFQRPANATEQPQPKDFGFEVDPQRDVTAYVLCPERSGRQQQLFSHAWIAVLRPDEMLFHFSADAALLLRRRSPGAKPVASFDCAKAASAAEKMICSSFELASWDRSVALAFRHFVDRSTARTPGPQTKSSADEQKKRWVEARAVCGSNADCIYEALWTQVEELEQLAREPPKPAKRCGWLYNPTPGNWEFTDRDATWEIARQGEEGALTGLPDDRPSGRRWSVETENGYGYSCMCLDMTANNKTREVIKIRGGKSLPLASCRKDKAIKRLEPHIR